MNRPLSRSRVVGLALGLSFACVGLAVAQTQGAIDNPGQSVAIESPEYLRAFVSRLSRHVPSAGDSPVRVLHYGDSNVAADIWTQMAREALQARFGRGGSGYLLPRGHGSWHRGPVRISSRGRWGTRRLGFGGRFGPLDGLWGLAGVAIEPLNTGATLRVDLPASARERVFELHLLGRPRPAGRVEVRVDGRRQAVVSARRAQPGLMVSEHPIAAGANRVEVRHLGGRPRVLGVAVEEGPGIVYDVLGINGHRISAILRWNRELLAAHLRHRTPDLVVLSYGGNEALDERLSMVEYERQLREASAMMRAMTPGASCLMVGPLSTCPEHQDRMSAVTDIQRRLAPELGCAFWDSSLVTGGHGQLCRWSSGRGLLSGDHLHLSRVGYEAVGRRFSEALMAEIDR